jgi:hypothetical protein
MINTFALLVVLGLLALTAYAGVRDGAYEAVFGFVRNLLAFVLAMTFAEPVSLLMRRYISAEYPLREYFVPIAFMLILGGTIALARTLKLSYLVSSVECPQLVDQLAGGFAGLFAGVILTGSFLVLWSLFPFPKYLPGDAGRISIPSGIDTGAAVLRLYGVFEGSFGAADFPLDYHEPIEPDVNENGRYDPDLDEGFYDLNRNGQWDRSWMWRYINHADITMVDLYKAVPDAALPPAPVEDESEYYD